MLKNKVLFYLLFFHFGNSLLAQNVVMYNYGTKEGLPSSETYDIIQDSDGFIWIATDRGVSRFDGYEFKNFTTNEGLVDNTVLNLYEDQKKRIWFLAITGNLCYYQNGKIVPYEYNAKLTEKKKFIIRSFHCDAEDNLTIGTLSRGIICINNQGELTEEKRVSDLRGVTIEKESNFINYGYNSGRPGTEFIDSITFHFKNGSTNFVKTLLGHTESSLNLSGLLRMNGDVVLHMPDYLYYWNGNDYQIKREESEILRIYEDLDSCLWISFISGGVKRYLPNETPFSSDFQNYLPGEKITSIHHDSEDGMWLATLSNGIYYVPSLEFQSFDMPPKFSITDLEYDQKSESVLVGFTNGTMQRYSTEGSIEKFNFNENRPDSVSNVFGIKILGNQIFVSTGRTAYVVSNSSAQEVNSIGYLRNILEHDGELIGCSNHKILSYDLQSKTSKIIATLPIRTENLFIDRNDRIWIGDYTGLFYLEDTSLVKAFPNNKFLAERISGISEMDNGDLVVSTIGKGLLLIRGENVIQIGEAQGLVSNVINCLILDTNELWLGTNKGISRVTIDADKIKVENFTKENGLPGTEVYHLVRTENLIWAATKNQLFYFNPASILRNSNPPKIYIEKIFSSGHKVNKTDSAFYYEDFPIRINFTGLAYKEHGDVVYKYRLVGLDSVWQFTNARFVEFYSLPAGDFVFEVLAQNEDGIWSNKPAVYKFSIVPPFWQTLTFMLLMSLLVLLIVSGLFYARIQYIYRKNKLSSDILNYRQQALAGQINPHFLHNSLNSIQSFMMTDDKRSASKYLSNFSKLMQKSLEHSRLEMVSLGDEITLIETYISLEKLRFNNKFSFEIVVSEKIDCGRVFIPSMILQPFIENAILHGVNESDKTDLVILISFEMIDEVLSVKINDNGIGIEQSKLKKESLIIEKKSAGTSITTDRLRALCVSMQQPFRLEMIDLSMAGSGLSGTSITFNLPYKLNFNATESTLN